MRRMRRKWKFTQVKNTLRESGALTKDKKLSLDTFPGSLFGFVLREVKLILLEYGIKAGPTHKEAKSLCADVASLS